MLLFEAPHEPPRPATTAKPGVASVTRRRLALFAGCAAAALVGLALGDPAPRMAADPEIAVLLRGMATIKAALVLAAIALIAWRLGRPESSRFATVYIVGAAVMAGTTALIWQLTALPAAAVAFHAAEITLLVAAWRDLG
ncbi:MAG: hypothetical protein ACK59M_06655 [Pseudomonadota bacterium]|jgi:hypothetical protein